MDGDDPEYMKKMEEAFDEYMLISNAQLDEGVDYEDAIFNPEAKEFKVEPTIVDGNLEYNIIHPYAAKKKYPPLKWVAPMNDVRSFETQLRADVKEHYSREDILTLECAVSHQMGTMQGAIVYNDTQCRKKHKDIYKSAGDFVALLDPNFLVFGDVGGSVAIRTRYRHSYVGFKDWELKDLDWCDPEFRSKLVLKANMQNATEYRGLVVLFTSDSDSIFDLIGDFVDLDKPVFVMGLSLDHPHYIRCHRSEKDIDGKYVDKIGHYYHGKRLDFCDVDWSMQVSHSVLVFPYSETDTHVFWKSYTSKFFFDFNIRLQASCIPTTVDFPVSPSFKFSEKVDGELLFLSVNQLSRNEGRTGNVLTRSGEAIGHVFTNLPYGVYVSELVVDQTTKIFVSQPLFAWTFRQYKDWFSYVEQNLADPEAFYVQVKLENQPILIEGQLKEWYNITYVRNGFVVCEDGTETYKCKNLSGDHIFGIQGRDFEFRDSETFDAEPYRIKGNMFSEGVIFLNGDRMVGCSNFNFSKLECYFWKRPERCTYEDYIMEVTEGGVVLGNLGEYLDPNNVYYVAGVYEVSVFGNLIKHRPEKQVGDSLWYKTKMNMMATDQGVRLLSRPKEYTTRMKYKAGVVMYLPDEVDVTGEVMELKSQLVNDPLKKYKFYLDDLPSKKIYPGMVVRVNNTRYYVTKFKPKFDSEQTDGNVKVCFVLRLMEFKGHLIPRVLS